MMREELRDLIQDKVDQTELGMHINATDAKLVEAIDLLKGTEQNRDPILSFKSKFYSIFFFQMANHSRYDSFIGLNFCEIDTLNRT